MDCAPCHPGAVASLHAPGRSLGFIHGQNGMGCLDCHDQASLVLVHQPGASETVGRGRERTRAFCLGCHDLAAIKDKGAAQGVEGLAMKPHDHWHYSAQQPWVDCTLCHRAHRPPRDQCFDCHLAVPRKDWETPPPSYTYHRRQ
ncbi:MAG: cytochrome c3 family protein [Holophaga sp.]|nr:cytochrome c3 family protein [Holophaga sp.]